MKNLTRQESSDQTNLKLDLAEKDIKWGTFCALSMDEKICVVYLLYDYGIMHAIMEDAHRMYEELGGTYDDNADIDDMRTWNRVIGDERIVEKTGILLSRIS